MADKTKIIAQPGAQELFIIRVFDAPRTDVFKAFSNPEILVRFFAPFDRIMQFNYHDYQTGGRYSWSNKKGEKTLCTFAGVIHELTSPIRIIQTSEFMELREKGNVILEIMTFDELPGDRTKLTIHNICPSLATRDAMINSDMEKGLTDIFLKLDHLLLNSHH
ncbi:MAG TPA: SRPBCC domain-containing protein [Mucilaginibacter sp.]|jgi:uncharacterized protein YndB with AHSA1/START domain|nr:SRPBCC domain-containing protein [Mucilaginibacter sp.]